MRRYSSADKPEPPENDLTYPTYWIRPPQIPSAAPGMHRFVWDLRHTPPDALRHDYPMTATYHDTPREPRGPIALPGEYTVRLTVDGKSFMQPLTVKMDPRVKTPPAGLKQQFDLSVQCWYGIRQARQALQEVRAWRAELKESLDKAKDETALKDLTGRKGCGARGDRSQPRGAKGGRARRAEPVPVLEEEARVLEILRGAVPRRLCKRRRRVTKCGRRWTNS